MTIWCIGKNYAAHIAEMGPVSKPPHPVVFQKAAGCLVPYGTPIVLPPWSSSIHHELELAFLLGPGLQPQALALALDLTARDIQERAKSEGLPWSLSKSFKNSCAVTPWISLVDPQIQNWPGLEFKLTVNGSLKQRGRGEQMIFPLPDLLAYLKERFPVEPGDLVLTGTPAGVGPLNPGDQLTLELESFQPWKWAVAPA